MEMTDIWIPVGQADADDVFQHLGVDPKLPGFQGVDLVSLEQVREAEDGADALGKGGGHGGGRYAPFKDAYEQQVKEDVQHRGEDEVVEGPLAVAQGHHDALKGIVHDDDRRAHEVPTEVGFRLGEHGGVRAHPPQDMGGQEHPHHGEKEPAQQAKEHVGVDGLADLVAFSGSEVSGDHHPCAGGRAVEEADEQADEGTGGADGGQGFLAQEVAYDEGVGRVIELLEELAQK